MATSQWRKFAFFDAFPVDIPIDTVSQLIDLKLQVVLGSKSSVLLGDENGFIHFLDRGLQISSYRFYASNINVITQVQGSPFVFTVGEDDVGAPSIFKVWDVERNSPSRKPVCVHSTRLPIGRPAVTCVRDDLSVAAVGFTDGSVVLLTGDFTRNRPAKFKVIYEGKSPVTGLAWKESRNPCLFITTQNEVYCYRLGGKEKEKDKLVLCDSIGASLKCSVLADLRNDPTLFIARDDAIYSYSGGADTRGTCYAFDGEKKLLHWYRGYLILVLKEETSSGLAVSEQVEKHVIYVVDVSTRSIVFSTSTSPVLSVFQMWGSIYVYTADDRMLELREKDLKTKLDLLFKKSLYDVAIRSYDPFARKVSSDTMNCDDGHLATLASFDTMKFSSIAKSHQYDPDSLALLFRQYGDHLYAKGDHSNAMQQYVKTIGRLEPSYVIRKYLDSPRIQSLTFYLEALHKERLASEDHTTLLINCYAKLRDSVKLNAFLSKDTRLAYDVETAIKICRQGGYIDEALAVSRSNGRYDAALKILIEDRSDYSGAVDYLATLNMEQVESALRQYGSTLLAQLPDVTTRLVTDLCLKFQSTGDEALGILYVEDFLPIFAARPDKLSEFLEEVLKKSASAPVSLYHTLLENYLLALTSHDDLPINKTIEDKALHLLSDPSLKLRDDQALIACQSTHFTKGVLLLYEKAKMYGQILGHHLKSGSWEKALSTCRRFGAVDPSLWVKLLRECVHNKESPSYCMAESLNAVEKGQLMSPLLIIELLCKSPNVDLGRTREFILRMLVSEENSREEDEKIIEELREDSRKIRSEIKELQETAIVFQGSKCSVCSQPLDMPSVHFLCQHSFHQRCFDSYAESEECTVCLPANKRIREQLKALEPSPNVDAFFAKQLSEADNCFSVVAEYFGKGLFAPSISPDSILGGQPVKQAKSDIWAEGSVSEARLRIQDRQAATVNRGARELPEGKTRLGETTSFVPVQKSEGRMRLEKTVTTLPSPVESEARMRLQDRKSLAFESTEKKTIPRSSVKSDHASQVSGSYGKTSSSPYRRLDDTRTGMNRHEARTLSGSLPSKSAVIFTATAVQSPISPTNPFANDDGIDDTNPFADSDDVAPEDSNNPFESENNGDDIDYKNPFEE